jgi:hypothetical protein
VLHLSAIPVSLIGTIMLWAAAILTLVTGWDYLMSGLRHVVPSMAMPPEPPRGPGVERLQTASPSDVVHR